MPRAKDDGTAQGNYMYCTAWLVDVYHGPSHHPWCAAFSTISNKAYTWLFFFFFHGKYKLSRRVLSYSVRCKGGRACGNTTSKQCPWRKGVYTGACEIHAGASKKMRLAGLAECQIAKPIPELVQGYSWHYWGWEMIPQADTTWKEGILVR